LHVLAVLVVHLFVPNALIVSEDILLPDLEDVLGVDLGNRLVLSVLMLLAVFL